MGIKQLVYLVYLVLDKRCLNISILELRDLFEYQNKFKIDLRNKLQNVFYSLILAGGNVTHTLTPYIRVNKVTNKNQTFSFCFLNPIISSKRSLKGVYGQVGAQDWIIVRISWLFEDRLSLKTSYNIAWVRIFHKIEYCKHVNSPRRGGDKVQGGWD